MPGCEGAAAGALLGQKRVTPYNYYSTIKFFALRVGGDPGPYTYDLAAGVEARAFAYEVNQPKQAGGYTAGDGNATIADTNLTTRSQTIGGQNVLVNGIAIQPLPAGMHLNDGDAVPHRLRLLDYTFLAALMNNVSVELSLNADENTFRMGTMGMIPGAGGLTGGAPDLVGIRGLAGDQESLPYPTNGWPVRSNAFKFAEGLTWRNQSNADSQLNIIFRNTRLIRVFSGGDVDNAALGVDVGPDNLPANVATGAGGYEYPSEAEAAASPDPTHAAQAYQRAQLLMRTAGPVGITPPQHALGPPVPQQIGPPAPSPHFPQPTGGASGVPCGCVGPNAYQIDQVHPPKSCGPDYVQAMMPPSRILVVPDIPAVAPQAVSPGERLEFAAGGGWLIAWRGSAVDYTAGAFRMDELTLASIGVRMFLNDGEELITNGQGTDFAFMSDLFPSTQQWSPIMRRVDVKDILNLQFVNRQPVAGGSILTPSLMFAFWREKYPGMG
jgi:hypothetical protein